MNMEKKIILEEKDFTAIVTYLRSVPVAFDRIEAAAAVKAAVGRAMLADIKFDNKQAADTGFENKVEDVSSHERHKPAPDPEGIKQENGTPVKENGTVKRK